MLNIHKKCININNLKGGHIVKKFDEILSIISIVVTVAGFILTIVDFTLGYVFSGCFMLFITLVNGYSTYKIIKGR